MKMMVIIPHVSTPRPVFREQTKVLPISADNVMNMNENLAISLGVYSRHMFEFTTHSKNFKSSDLI